MSDDDREIIRDKIIRQAKRGCRASQKLIADRIEPPRRSVGKFKLPDTIATLEDVDTAILSLARAQAAGTILPDEATAALATIESIRETIRDKNAVKILKHLEGKFQ